MKTMIQMNLSTVIILCIVTSPLVENKSQDEDLSTQVAAPPKLASKVQTIKELDSAVKFNLPSSKVHVQFKSIPTILRTQALT
jgi:hypothetical protein